MDRKEERDERDDQYSLGLILMPLLVTALVVILLLQLQESIYQKI